MAVARPNEPIRVDFNIDQKLFSATVNRGQIVHEAFHAAVPAKYTAGKRLTFATRSGVELFADNFVGEIVDHFGSAEIVTTSRPVSGSVGKWTNVGIDHLAIAVADRNDATTFFRDVIKMRVMRQDAHLTVLSSGHTALFLFDAGSDQPMTPDKPSSWHHLGFVVDNLEHAVVHLRTHESRLSSDFTLLERDERWSLYLDYQNGEVTFMIQFSEIKPDYLGFVDPNNAVFARSLYDYSSRPYGLQFEDIQSE